MASHPSPIFLFLLACCLMCLCFARAQQDPGIIPVGSFIVASEQATNSRWLSPSGRFALGFYPVEAAFAVGVWFVTNTTIIWTADRDDDLYPAGTQLILTDEGLKISNPAGDRPICNISASAAKLDSASMLDSGDFIIRDINKDVMWQTFDYPTDTLMAGQVLRTDQRLVSSVSSDDHRSGRFEFVLEHDGELIFSPVNTPRTRAHTYWFLGTGDEGVNGIFLDFDGNLTPIFNRNATHNSTLNLPTQSFARMEPDGFLRIYSTTNNSTRQTGQFPPNVNDKCIVKGTCGANSICNSTYASGESSGKVNCVCLPGFVYADPSRTYMGCLRNFSMGQCAATNDSKIHYSIARLANVGWNDDPYNYTNAATEKDCSNSCLEDCNCYAVLYENQRCRKQRQPLLYPRWSADDQTVALLKVGSGEQPPTVEVKRVPSNKILLLSSTLASVLVMALAAGVFFLYTTREPSYQKQCRNMETVMAGGMAPRSFTYGQLADATGGFKNLLGTGGFSTVYKGEIRLAKPTRRKETEARFSIFKRKAKQDGQTDLQKDHGTDEVMHVAVKVLKKMNRGDEKRFRIEMRAAGRAHHRNIVRLLGFCHEGTNFILVYEYIPKGSLANLIFDPKKRPSWKERVDIALDVARGLHYLHEGCGSVIIHSDIKPQNVLIDEDGTAKITDLGLAKTLQPWESKAYTRPRGTVDYKAPEWKNKASEPVTSKVDVYSFGVLLLELVTCRTFFMEQALEGRYILSELAYKFLSESTLERLIPEGEMVDQEELKKMVVLALFCLQRAPDNRPAMKDVVRILGGKMSMSTQLPPNPSAC
ncbi:hypothetical protein HPP92_009304 [Vanilla planifolia]|uniref:Receptor-like serine/threonine-protein kinase n=1 Tax=Vanilla planifolia TaxID=51239 RepID=A0A835R493_VANPL|nr:hypothetical protein HPP92_009304 [Vanilla planifolia]